MVVEMRHVLGQHCLEVVAVDNQHPVQQFAADGADPSFGDRVRPGCPHRGAQDAHALASEHGIEDAGELAVAVPDHERELSHAIAEVHQEVARLLGKPGTAGVGRDPQKVHPAGGVLHHEQHVQPVQQHRVDAEEVGGEDAVGLGGEELPPGGAATARRGIDAGSLQDHPHRAGRKSVAEPGEFTVDPPVPPGRVLRGQTQHQLAQLGCRGSAAGAAVSRLVPSPCHQIPVPAQHRFGGHDPMQSASLGQPPGQRCEDSAVRPGQPWPAHLAPEHGDLVP